MSSIERGVMHSLNLFDHTVEIREGHRKIHTGVDDKDNDDDDTTMRKKRAIIALCQVDMATRCFIVRTTEPVYHHCLIWLDE